MTGRALGWAAVLAIAWSRAAPAQITLPKDGAQARAALTPKLAVVATTSLTPYALSGKLGDSWILVNMIGVSLSPFGQKTGTVMLEQPLNPRVVLMSTSEGVPNGAYSVQFTFSHLSNPSVVRILGPSGAAVAECTLAAGPNTTTEPPRVCDSGVLQVADRALWVTLSVVEGYQLQLASITVNALQSPLTRR